MSAIPSPSPVPACQCPRAALDANSRGAFLRRLADDAAGNAIAIVAGAIIPLMALIGSGVDVGRTYLIQSRLQQACDAGVLGARKQLGGISHFDPSIDGIKIADKGDRFFNVNFADGIYKSVDRDFWLAIEDDMSITGHATVTAPMTIMQFFGKQDIPLSVTCTAQLEVANTDIMMGLDVTGSMNEVNLGDTDSKMNILKSVVKQFFNTMEANKQTGSRIRYGFVPYSTNVNVGPLLKDGWVATQWTYPSRVLSGTGAASGTFSYYSAVSPVSGTYQTTQNSTYAATFNSTSNTYSCPSKPANTATQSSVLMGTTSTTVSGPPAGTRTVGTYNRTTNGTTYAVSLSGQNCTVNKTQYSSYVDTYQYITEPKLGTGSQWSYKDITKDVSGWRTGSNGCIEERDTYDINDYDNVDLKRAPDLDIDLVPNPSDTSTQWRPQYPNVVYERAMLWNLTGSFTQGTVNTTAEYVAPAVAGFAACPTAAKKLQTWTSSNFGDYINSLHAGGSTYHDIGMIWAGRLLSPTGIFASENKDISASRPTGRNLIFLTDGQTSSLDINYGAYGVEPLARRRWSSSSALTLTETIEKRFSFACEEVKKKNITVWFIAFGTDLNPVMTQCAGEGHYFSAANAGELNTAFETIAKSIGDLRLSN